MRLFYRLAYLGLLNYWYLFRPASRGVHCLITYKGQALLIHHTYGLGYWELPGGGFYKGETPEQAIRREVLEEVGLKPIKFKQLGTYITLHEYKTDTVTAFTANVQKPEFTLTSPEILEARWFPLKSLPDSISPHIQKTLALFR